MLHAKLHGKLRYDADGNAKLSEDSLTSTIFERLAYLPDDRLIAILFDPSLWPLRPPSGLPTSVGPVTFWPLWTWPKTIASAVTRRSTEPDLIIEFDDRILMIEAKRHDGTLSQYGDQLADEWWTAFHKFTDGRPISILAVSGLRNPERELRVLKRKALNRLAALSHGEFDDRPESFHLGYVSWRDLYLMTRKALSHDRPEQNRLLEDIGSGLVRHGVRLTAPCWLDDMQKVPWSILNNPLATDHFRRPDLPPLGFKGEMRTCSNFFRDGSFHDRG
ncbi:hypothetical protein [Azospirillum lipoferum]|uniref:Uncharacterized protein n=1 Tax=Azospirillum lipoferum (strain 4B) TaxID=862719 RepID=G7Z2G8_AZOL4|nr:hypothetical protein [Azospirillum lipoferum]CBS85584.1 protein of unknown function [Azospirillum lipoferum 4B]